jgi:hypothetical protein
MSGRRKKMLWSVGVLLALGGGFVGLVFWLGDEGPISPAGFERVRPGMTRAEVGRLLGPELAPSRLMIRSLAPTPEKEWQVDGGIVPSAVVVHWESERYGIAVAFVEDQAKMASLYLAPGGVKPTFWQRLRRWVTGG